MVPRTNRVGAISGGPGISGSQIGGLHPPQMTQGAANKSPPRLVQIDEHLEKTSAFANALAQRLQSLQERTLGTANEEPVGERAAPSGLCGAIEDRIDDIWRSLGRIAAATEALEQLA